MIKLSHVQIAMICHDAVRSYKCHIGERMPKPWHDTDEAYQENMLTAAKGRYAFSDDSVADDLVEAIATILIPFYDDGKSDKDREPAAEEPAAEADMGIPLTLVDDELVEAKHD